MTDEEFALEIIPEYINKMGVTVPVQFHFVDDINISCFLYARDKEVVRDCALKDFSKHNGLVMPFDGDTYHILIKKNYPQIRCTIIHESTHVIDYDDFRKSYNNGDIKIEFHPFYFSMALYSEFHARKMGHSYHLNNEMSNCDKDKEKQTEICNIYQNITNLEIQIRQNQFGHPKTELYDELMQQLGRYYAYDIVKLAPEYFSENIRTLYDCLISLDSEWNNINFEALTLAIKQLSNCSD